MRKFKEGDFVSWNDPIYESPCLGIVICYFEEKVIAKDRIIGSIWQILEKDLTPTNYLGDKVENPENTYVKTANTEISEEILSKQMKKFKQGDIVTWLNGHCQSTHYGYEVIGHELDKIIIQCRVTRCEYKADACDLYSVDHHHQNVAKEECFPIIELSKKPEPSNQANKKNHVHYFKDVSNLKEIDVYRVLTLFDVVNPCLAHAIKKLLVAGGRGGGKDIQKDVKEAMDSLARFIEMQQEDKVLK